MARSAYRLLPPKKGKRKHFTVIFQETRKKRVQRNTGLRTQRGAREWAHGWIRENSPKLCRLLDLAPLAAPKSPVIQPAASNQTTLPL